MVLVVALAAAGTLGIEACNRVVLGTEVSPKGFVADPGPARAVLEELLPPLVPEGCDAVVRTTAADPPREGGLLPEMDFRDASSYAEFSCDELTAEEMGKIARSLDAAFTGSGWRARSSPGTGDQPDSNCSMLAWTAPSQSAQAHLATWELGEHNPPRFELRVFAESASDAESGPATAPTDGPTLACFDRWVASALP